MIVLNGVDSLQQVVGDIGESTDLWTNTQTLMGFSAASYKHIHNPGNIIPATGAVIKVTSDAVAGTFGAFVDVVGAGAINRAFDIQRRDNVLIINGKMMLRSGGQIIKAGEKVELPDNVAESLIKAGLVEKAKRGEVATMPEVEKAVMPKPKRKKKEPKAGE